MKALKISIIVIALAGAVFFTLSYGDEEQGLRDSPESRTLWQCTKCDHRVEWTVLEYQEEAIKAGSIPLFCPKCGEKAVYQLMACLTCQTLFFGSEVPGQTGQCPKCRPDAELPPPPAEIEEEEEPIDWETNPKRVRPKSL